MLEVRFSKRGTEMAKKKVVNVSSDNGRPAMRWYVSIGMVLGLGALAWGDVAGIAAPSPQSELADTKENVPSVEVELAIAVDVSYSMALAVLAVHRAGYPQSIVS